MLLETLDDGIQIHRVTGPADVARFHDGFVEAYREVFALPPYEERFTADEASRVWRMLTRAPHHITLIAVDDGRVIGFGVAIPLHATNKVARNLHGLVPPRHTMYLAELGILPDYRGRKLGKYLVKQRIKLIDQGNFSHVVLRVADGRTSSFEMYRSLDFTDMGVSMQVSQRRTDGEIRSDERHFMSRVLSQVRLDD